MGIAIKKGNNWFKSFFGGIIICILIVLAFPFILVFVLFAGMFGFISIDNKKKEIPNTSSEYDANTKTKTEKVDGKTFLEIIKEYHSIVKEIKKKD
jgi:hypothetical protein